jgi:hypothetical protein
MPAKRIAGMARSYKYLQADRRNCPQFAARQRDLEDAALPPTYDAQEYSRDTTSTSKQLQLLMPPAQVVQAHADAQ